MENIIQSERNHRIVELYEEVLLYCIEKVQFSNNKIRFKRNFKEIIIKDWLVITSSNEEVRYKVPLDYNTFENMTVKRFYELYTIAVGENNKTIQQYNQRVKSKH